MKRLFQVCAVLGLAVVVASCGGNSTLNETEAAVYLSAEITLYNPDIGLSTYLPAFQDVSIETMSISSHPKNPSAPISAAQDVTLSRWVVKPYRTDGGSTASPEWSYDLDIFVPAGGEATLDNYRVYPAEFFSQVPLSYLLPENGGVDPETGQTNIRQTMGVEIFGVTAGGKSVSVRFNVAFNFTW